MIGVSAPVAKPWSSLTRRSTATRQPPALATPGSPLQSCPATSHRYNTQYQVTEFATLETKTRNPRGLISQHGLTRGCPGQETGTHAEPFGRAQQVLPHVWDPVSMFLASRVLLGPFMAPLMMAHACLG